VVSGSLKQVWLRELGRGAEAGAGERAGVPAGSSQGAPMIPSIGEAGKAGLEEWWRKGPVGGAKGAGLSQGARELNGLDVPEDLGLDGAWGWRRT